MSVTKNNFYELYYKLQYPPSLSLGKMLILEKLSHDLMKFCMENDGYFKHYQNIHWFLSGLKVRIEYVQRSNKF